MKSLSFEFISIYEVVRMDSIFEYYGKTLVDETKLEKIMEDNWILSIVFS